MNAHVSPMLARHRAYTDLLKSDRARALLLCAEAVADHRADNDINALAKLARVRDLIRTSVATMTGEPFKNEFFP